MSTPQAEHEPRVVAITGASSGIGEATALRLAAEGARVVLGARREEPLRALAARIADAGGDAAYVTTDVSKRHDMSELVALARDRFGRLDALVNNAGIMPISQIADLQTSEWDDMIDVNLRGVLHGIAAALPLFQQQGSGHIINLSSTAALQLAPAMAVYAATKQAVATISDGLRQEMAGAIRVTVIYPGMTNTNFASTMSNPELRAQLEKRRQSQSLPPDAIAKAIAYAIAAPADVDISQIVVRPTG
jgi:NADP-dependent 3-hydroxy acid dehydrogenase YdfG